MALRLDPQEQTLLELPDAALENLLKDAQNGNLEQKEKLCQWAYLNAYHYYRLKISVEKTLSREDAEELATEFFLEFEKALLDLKSATRFTRYLLKRNLGRFLRRKKTRLFRERLFPNTELDKHAGESSIKEPGEPWQNWSDQDFLQYETVLKTLAATDETTKRIIEQRIEKPPRKYSEIASHLKISETAVRMRVTRFYALVRKKYKEFVTKIDV